VPIMVTHLRRVFLSVLTLWSRAGIRAYDLRNMDVEVCKNVLPFANTFSSPSVLQL